MKACKHFRLVSKQHHADQCQQEMISPGTSEQSSVQPIISRKGIAQLPRQGHPTQTDRVGKVRLNEMVNELILYNQSALHWSTIHPFTFTNVRIA